MTSSITNPLILKTRQPSPTGGPLGKEIHQMYRLFFENDLTYVRDRTEEQVWS